MLYKYKGTTMSGSITSLPTNPDYIHRYFVILGREYLTPDPARWVLIQTDVTRFVISADTQSPLITDTQMFLVAKCILQKAG